MGLLYCLRLPNFSPLVANVHGRNTLVLFVIHTFERIMLVQGKVAFYLPSRPGTFQTESEQTDSKSEAWASVGRGDP